MPERMESRSPLRHRRGGLRSASGARVLRPGWKLLEDPAPTSDRPGGVIEPHRGDHPTVSKSVAGSYDVAYDRMLLVRSPPTHVPVLENWAP